MILKSAKINTQNCYILYPQIIVTLRYVFLTDHVSLRTRPSGRGYITEDFVLTFDLIELGSVRKSTAVWEYRVSIQYH